MTEFLFTYHGGNKPNSPEEGQKLMAEWQAWAQDLGDRLTNPGSPTGKTKILTKAGISGSVSSNPISGYSIIQAENIEEALDLLKNCPHLAIDGTLEVSEIMGMD